MRALFGVVSLLVALAVVGVLVAKQSKTAASSIAAAPGSAAASGASTPVSIRVQSQQLQQRVAGDVAKALEQGARRSEDADQ